MKCSPRILQLRPCTALVQSLQRHTLTRPGVRHRLNPNQSRSFSNPLNPVQTLTASRILAYPARDVFNIIADISSYPEFIPYCKSSAVTSLSSKDSTHGKKWPRTADLRISYGPYDEVFRSNVYCVPYTALEAVSGDAQPTLSGKRIEHYQRDGLPEEAPANESLFTSLLTRWTFKEYPFKPMPPDNKSPQEGNAEANTSAPRTEVGLVIEVQFASAAYSLLSQAVAPKVAGMMVEAFEKRAQQVLGEGHLPFSRAEEDGERSALQGAVGGSMKM